MDDNVKNILYVAIAIDMASGERLPSAKIGISATNADKRITQLNSTKMPISVELTAAWTFEGAKISARDAESAAHTLLRPLQVNGEWYSDDDDDLSDRIAKFVKKLGAKPVGDDTAEYAAMNEKQRKVRDLLESAFEKLRPQLDGLGIEWEYMQWRVGLTTPLGRMMAEVKKSGHLYLYLFHEPSLSLNDLNSLSSINWRTRSVEGRALANQVGPEQLMSFLNAIPRNE